MLSLFKYGWPASIYVKPDGCLKMEFWFWAHKYVFARKNDMNKSRAIGSVGQLGYIFNEN